MPILKNPRHERFAQLLASGKTAVDAYEQSGYRRNEGNGAALARVTEIRARVTEINSKAAERTAVTLDGLIADAERIQRGAIEAGQWAAATAALKERGVLSGKRIERRESGQPGEFEAIENMTADELRNFVFTAAEATGLCEDDPAESAGARAPRRLVN